MQPNPDTAIDSRHTHMAHETAACPNVVAEALAQDETRYRDLGALLRQRDPAGVLTVARGSSDHACAYLAFALMRWLGLLTASLPPSYHMVYRSRLRLQNQVVVGISQSGQSPDLVETMQDMRQQGSFTLGFINAPVTQLHRVCDQTLPLRAGVERSVAATKSFVASLLACARLVAHWANASDLLQSLPLLPEALHQALKVDWSVLVEALRNEQRMLVVGRGMSLSLAQEFALKLKETCALQAEAISGAELLHGPLAIVQPGYPVLVLAFGDESQESQRQLAAHLQQLGANVWLASASAQPIPGVNLLPLPQSPHTLLAPLAACLPFYLLANDLSLARGLDPDAPAHLRKVTLTR